jgi:DNA-binding response OmpR family regulator
MNVLDPCGGCDTPEQERPCAGRPFVLFADDDPLVLKALVRGAEKRGICADTATTAREILHKVNKHCGEWGNCYDMVVADVNYMDAQGKRSLLTGITAGDQIRRSYPDLPILYVTGFASSMVRQQIRKQGADVVEKPFEIEALLDRVMMTLAVAGSDYQGPERRNKSINQSGHTRRRTDRPLEVPKVVEKSLADAHANAKAS